MVKHPIRGVLTKAGVLAARPSSFLIVGIYALAWMIFDTATFNWQGVAPIFTLMMTLLIQRAEHRDTQAL